MAVYTSQPALPIDILRAARMRLDVVGNGIDGGVNGLGESISVETSGGGIVTASYEGLMLEGPDEAFEIMCGLGARLNGGFRFIDVPFITDEIGPFPIINGKRRPFNSDGSPTVYGALTANATVGAGVLSVQVFGAARDLRHSDWFSIYHPTKGWRAYRYWQVISKTTEENPIYQLAISPALREAAASGTAVRIARPLCVMKLARGMTIPLEYEAYYHARPSIQLTEAF